MYFAIISQDVPNSLPLRQSVRPNHLKRLHTLHNEGRLLLAGPFPASAENTPKQAGFTGSLIVADFTSQEECQTWADADPYVTAGVYAQITVKPFKKVFPK